MNSVISWGNTKAVLEDLEKLLYCGICSCIEDVEDNNCPSCGLPFHTKDIQLNRQLATAVSLCYQLDNLLYPDNGHGQVSSSNSADQSTHEAHSVEQQATLSDGDSEAAASLATPAGVFDFTTEASSPGAPSIHRRTRGAIKKEKKREFLAQTNARWAIGDETADVDKCSSCSRSDSKRVSFRGRSISMSGGSTSGSIANVVAGVVQNFEKSRALAPAARAKRAKTRRARTKQTKSRAQATPFSDPPPSISEQSAENEHGTEANTEVQVQQDSGSSQSPTGQVAEESMKPRDGGQSPCKNPINTSTPQRTINTSNCKLRRVLARSAQATPESVLPPQSSGKRGRGSLGASPNSTLVSPVHIKRNRKGETPLHVAVIKGDLSRVKCLLEEGAELNTRDHAGWTPLHEACNHGYKEIVEMLLDHGALINMPGHENETPLHDAINNSRLDCVCMLVSRGADLLSRNLHGKTAWDLARTEEMTQALSTALVQEKVAKTVTVTSSSLEYRPLVFLTSMLSREQQNRVQACARLLNSKVVQTFTNEVSHLISSVNSDGMCPRSLKYMEAVLRGIWIVNMDWVETSLEYEQRVSEEPFEVPGSSTNPNSQAPTKGRTNKVQQLPGLFDGCHFYFQGNFGYPFPKLPEIHHLITIGGGVVLKREPRLETICQSDLTIPYHARQDSQLASCSFYIIYAGKEVEGHLEGGRLCRASAKWLMNCIAFFELRDPPETSNNKI